eukprot:1159345-Pelagomonas_calceolata.AAC.4
MNHGCGHDLGVSRSFTTPCVSMQMKAKHKWHDNKSNPDYSAHLIAGAKQRAGVRNKSTHRVSTQKTKAHT